MSGYGGQDDPRDDPGPCDNHDGPEKLPKKLATVCVKCNEAKPTYLCRNESVCWNCFDLIVQRKFKQGILFSRLTRQEKMPMLVAYSGSMISATLLHLAADLPNRSFIDKPIVGHVDVSAIFELNEEARDRFLSGVRAKCQDYNLRCEIIPIEDILLDSADQDPTTTAAARREKLRDILKSATSLTAKEDLYSHMIRAALLTLAKRLNLPRIVLGNTATDLAVKLIADTSKGRGFQLPAEISWAETPKELGIVFSQPFKDLLRTELAYYFHKHNLSALDHLTLADLTQKQKSINLLTEDFILRLQNDFNHTIHTPLRSSDKLSTGAGKMVMPQGYRESKNPSEKSKGGSVLLTEEQVCSLCL